MSQVSNTLRKVVGGYAHWCEGCKETHRLPDSWQFDGNVDKPTFVPSFRHTGVITVNDDKGEWTGEWQRDASGNTIPYVCHYVITDGKINYCPDTTHELRGKNLPLAPLPDWLRDQVE